MDLGRAGFTIPFVLGRVCGGLLCWENLPLIDKCGRRAFLLAGNRSLIIALAAICVLHFHSSPPFGDTRDPTADGIFAAVCVYFSLLQQRHVKLVSLYLFFLFPPSNITNPHDGLWAQLGSNSMAVRSKDLSTSRQRKVGGIVNRLQFVIQPYHRLHYAVAL